MTTRSSTLPMVVGVGATRALWSAALRAYVRNHLLGVTAEAVLDGRQLRRPGKRPLDALVVDDVTRLFGAADIAEVVAAGTVVIGLFDAERGLGRRYLEELGVSRLFPVSTPVAELAAELAHIGPINAGAPTGSPTSPPSASGEGPAGRSGRLTVWTAVSGGAGLSEAVVAAAELLARRRATLLVEANPIAAVLAARLGRDAYYGLAWTLARVGQGQDAFPKGLTPAWPEQARAKVHFDVVCQSMTSGGPPLIEPGPLAALAEEARRSYEQVLVEVGPVVGASPVAGWDRFAAGRALLARADRVVVLAGPDPESAGRLVEWRAAAGDWGLTAPVAAVFGRVSGRGGFEASHLRGLVESSTGGGFASVHVLPEDPVVSRARWNGELVRRGRWRAALSRLVDELDAPRTPAIAASPPVTLAGTARAGSLATEVGWS